MFFSGKETKPMAELERFVSGYRLYKATQFPKHRDVLRHRTELQEKPHTLVVTSCSLPVGVETLLSASPGEIYTVRNLGGIVPEYDASRASGVISAIEYAVAELQVKNVVVLNHTGCDGIRLVMDDGHLQELKKKSSHIAAWMEVAAPAKAAVKAQLAEKSEEFQADACEREVILVCMRNLLSYPFVKERAAKNEIGVYGWHFDVAEGILSGFNPNTGNFDPFY
jgi:carbonic anhydrase